MPVAVFVISMVVSSRLVSSGRSVALKGRAPSPSCKLDTGIAGDLIPFPQLLISEQLKARPGAAESLALEPAMLKNTAALGEFCLIGVHRGAALPSDCSWRFGAKAGRPAGNMA
jgi:hypothetical protein